MNKSEADRSPEILVVDDAFEIMTNEQLVKCLHGAAHELFRRAERQVDE